MVLLNLAQVKVSAPSQPSRPLSSSHLSDKSLPKGTQTSISKHDLNLISFDCSCAYPNNTLLFPFSGSKPDIVNPNIWYDCHNTTSPLEVFTVSPSKKYAAFHVVNSGAVWDLRVSIDSHDLIVFAADGAYVKPQTKKAVTLGIGQRYSFFVKLDQPVAGKTIVGCYA